jgi:hypothetical protein
MLFGKKEDKQKLPDLPPFKAQFKIDPGMNQQYEAESPETHSLPAFPDSPTYNKFSQAAIKDAVGTPEPELPPFPVVQQTKPKAVEIKEWTPTLPPRRRAEEENLPLPDSPPGYVEEDEEEVEEVEEEEEEPQTFPQRRETVKPYPLRRRPVPEFSEREEIRSRRVREIQRTPSNVFVRIDKFNVARKSLSQAEDSLKQIDELVKKIRETKLREDQELSAWEQDLMQVKARINEVSENLFEKFEE